MHLSHRHSTILSLKMGYIPPDLGGFTWNNSNMSGFRSTKASEKLQSFTPAAEMDATEG